MFPGSKFFGDVSILGSKSCLENDALVEGVIFLGSIFCDDCCAGCGSAGVVFPGSKFCGDVSILGSKSCLDCWQLPHSFISSSTVPSSAILITAPSAFCSNMIP